MTETNGDQPTARSFVDQEHAQVRAIARQIESTEDATVLLTLLKEHRGTLRHHFAVEEAEDGLYDSIMAEAPQHQHRVDQMKAQHADFLAEIDELCAAVPDDAESGAEILVTAKAIARRLDDHEAAENHLLLEVFETDIGTGD